MKSHSSCSRVFNSRVVDVTMSYQTLTNHRDHVSISWAFSEGMALKEMAFKLCKISSYTTRNITMTSESCKNDSCYVLFYLVCGMRDDLCRNRSRSLRGVNSKAGCELWKENVIFLRLGINRLALFQCQRDLKGVNCVTNCRHLLIEKRWKIAHRFQARIRFGKHRRRGIRFAIKKLFIMIFAFLKLSCGRIVLLNLFIIFFNYWTF